MILALTDAPGNRVSFLLLPEHRFDTVGVAPLIAGVEFGALLADTAFDSTEAQHFDLWASVGGRLAGKRGHCHYGNPIRIGVAFHSNI